MKYPMHLTIAAALLALPFSVHAQTNMQTTSAAQDANATDGAQAAMRMVPAQGALVTSIDAKKD